MSPEVAIIVRAYNEERHIGALLESLANQSFTDFETIVVDSGLRQTRRCRSRMGWLAKAVQIASRDFTFGFSLNAGIQLTSAPIVAIVSAHTLPVAATWLAALVAPFRDQRVAMVYGRQRGLETSKFSERLDFERTFRTEPEVMRPQRLFCEQRQFSDKTRTLDPAPVRRAFAGFGGYCVGEVLVRTGI